MQRVVNVVAAGLPVTAATAGVVSREGGTVCATAMPPASRVRPRSPSTAVRMQRGATPPRLHRLPPPKRLDRMPHAIAFPQKR